MRSGNFGQHPSCLVMSMALVAALSGCASARDADAVASKSERLSILDVRGEVLPGERGQAVLAVYEYLRQFGYFPNRALEKQYPYWVAMVPDEPPNPSSYGPELEEGVSAYQKFMGLPVTGRVDERTLELMKTPRCGHPENEFAALDPDDKWALFNGVKWNKSTVTYRLGASTDGNGLTTSSMQTALDAVLGIWQGVTNLTLSRITSGTPDTEVRWWKRGTPPSGASWIAGGNQVDFGLSTALGTAWGQTRLGLNTEQVWASTLTPGKFDIQTTLLHEVGHTLGLDHSSMQLGVFPNGTQAVMHPSQSSGSRTLPQPDDLQAVSALYQLWQLKPGAALDIAAGGPGTDSQGNPVKPKVYAAGGSNSLWYWTYNNTSPNFGAWVQILGNAVAVAVDSNGVPWVVSSDHTIWQGNGSDPTLFGFGWIARSAGSGANDIGANNGKIWIISNTAVPSAPGNFVVQSWNGLFWDSSNGGIGARITVDSFGRPWVVQANHTVWRFYAPSDSVRFQGQGTPAWQILSQLNPPNQGQLACATDIGAAMDESVWITGCTSMPNNNFDIWIWDEQPAQTGMFQAPQEGQFMPTDGFGVRIAAAPDSRPWAIQAPGYIFRRSAKTTTP